MDFEKIIKQEPGLQMPQRKSKKRTEEKPTQLNKRQKRLKGIQSPTPPVGATLCYYFADGSAFGGLIKVLLLSCNEGNFRFGPDCLQFVRANESVSVLNIVTLYNEKVLIKGDFSSIPNGFRFGVHLPEFSQVSTHSLTRNDSFLMYFMEDNSKMYTEQRNGDSASGQNLAILNCRRVSETNYNTAMDPNAVPNVCVPLKYFCTQCSFLASAKCPKLHIVCSKLGVVLKGKDAVDNDVKFAYFPSAEATPEDSVHTACANPIVVYQVNAKVLKTLIYMRNIGTAKSMVEIFYSADKSLMVRSYFSDNQGTFCTFIKNESGESHYAT